MTHPPRERSLWGWGWADRFPDDDGRRAVAAQLGAALGLRDLALHTPPTLDSLRMSHPRVAVPPELAAFASSERRERAMHTFGRSYTDIVRAFSGDFTTAPDLVVTPRTENDVALALAWGGAEHIAIVPFGGGTSVVHGVECNGDGFRGVASLDMTAMDRVLEVDLISRAARIQAGVLGPSLERQLAPHGLTLRHFPQSFEFSTLGGWIATRAGGHFATLHTHIDDLVQSLRMVTPRGIYETRPVPASGAGPSPDRLVLGSEGILGVITEAWMRLQAKPRWRSQASVFFVDFLAGARAAMRVAQAGLYPSNCRLLDPREAMLNGLPNEGGAVLLLGFESADHPTQPWMERALQLALASGGRCPAGAQHVEAGEVARDASAESWRRSFIDAPYVQSTLVSMGVIADTFETACTWGRFEALHARVSRDVRDAMKRTCGGGSLTCRLTHVYPDGAAPYFTFVAPGRAGGELEQWATIKHAASESIAACGATITHHHAVGRMHRPWYDRERPELFADTLRAAKLSLDPAGILNPGVLVDVRQPRA